MRKYSMETTVGIFLVCGLILIGYMTVNLGHYPLFGDQTYPLVARFTSVTGLKPDSPVYMLGIQIGHVESLSIDQKVLKVDVKIKINNGIEVYDDAIASIKTEGLIGERYLSINPGGGGDLLKPGDVITDTQPPIDIGDIIGKYAFGEVKK